MDKLEEFMCDIELEMLIVSFTSYEMFVPLGNLAYNKFHSNGFSETILQRMLCWQIYASGYEIC